jgi:hypothetical protein
MRVATISIYNNSKYELGRTFSSYSDAADTVNTGKKIKTPSDDPVGFSQVLDIDSTLSQMDQLHKNIDTGLTWLTNSETTLDSIRETILDAKVTAIAAVNGSYNSDDYDTAAAMNSDPALDVEVYTTCRDHFGDRWWAGHRWGQTGLDGGGDQADIDKFKAGMDWTWEMIRNDHLDDDVRFWVDMTPVKK